MKSPNQPHPIINLLFLPIIIGSLLLLPACGARTGFSPEQAPPLSDHFDGQRFYNPGSQSPTGEGPKRGVLGWVWHWLAGNDWPDWPDVEEIPPGPPPPARAAPGELRIVYVGHSTFLIQMDGINILTDPIWSERCSPFSWAGPLRFTRPGLRLEDLPAIDAVLLSHNHYDHLDQPTLARLAQRGVTRSLVPLGNRELVREAGLTTVDELDWWQSVRLSPHVTITLVPSQHFSSRTLWDRNRALWGGFVISGPAGHVYFSGDSGYGPHFREIADRFAPIRAAILPIAPFQPKSNNSGGSSGNRLRVHMGPGEAVQAHLDLKAKVSLAAHFQVFQLGPDGFDDSVRVLGEALKEKNIKPDDFLTLKPGETWNSATNSTTNR
jgi:L-ascorbate metabolism protein UlaG (beta-lactamase superfamily)